MKHMILTLVLALISLTVTAADIPALNDLFKTNFDRFYAPRMCGMNITRLVEAAQERKINLSNSYVLKIVGSGFLETSGFYTRNGINERKMLGYFHYVLVADGYVYDFDLDEPLVLKLDDYVRLQFTPPYLPFTIWGINYDPLKMLPSWTVTKIETTSISGTPKVYWEKSMGDLIDLKKMMEKPRIR